MFKINFRPLFVVAVSLIFSTIVIVNICDNINFLSIMFASILLLAFIMCAVGFVASFCKGNNKFILFNKQYAKWFCCFILGVLIAGCAFGVVCLRYNNKVDSVSEVEVSGSISEVKQYNNHMVVNIDNLIINNCRAGGVLEVSISKSDSFNTSNFVNGNNIKFVAQIEKVDVNLDNVYKICNNVQYSSYTNVSNVEVFNGVKDVRDIIKHNVMLNFSSVMGFDNANIAYSILFGEKDNLSNEVYNMFSTSGLAHVLAVSGLHVGVLVLLIVKLLSLIKCNKHIKMITLFVLLLFYAYLTGFTASVVRASIMSLVLLASKLYGKEYDALSSLSLASIIIIMFSPLSIFTAGFQLSFGCVFAIITLSNYIAVLLEKLKLPTKIANALAISIAVNIGIFAIMAVHFKTISFVSIISNLFVLPMFSVCYTLLFACLIFTMFTSVFNFVLIIPNIILHFIKMLAMLFGELSVLNIEVFNVGYLPVIIILAAMFIIKFLLSKTSIKIAVASCLFGISILLIVLTNIPANFNTYSVMLNYAKYGNNAIITNNNNQKVLVLNNALNYDAIHKLASNYKINTLDAVVCYNYNVKDNESINKIIDKYNPKSVIFETTYKDYIINEFKGKTILKFYNNAFSECGINFEWVVGDSGTIALATNINNKKVLFVSDNINRTDTMFFIDYYDLIISNQNNFSFDFYDVDYDKILTYRETKHKNATILNNDVFFTKTF